MQTLLYVALCVPNSKLYFGVTRGLLKRRIQGHVRDARRDPPRYRFHRAIRKYGPNSFVWHEIGRADDATALELESFCVRYFDTQNPKNGYNSTPGGQMSLKDITEATRRRLCSRRHSEATKARMRESHLGQVSWIKGQKLTPEQTLSRLGNQNRSGKPASGEARARMSRAQIGNKNALGHGTPVATVCAALADVTALGFAGTARKYNVSEATVRWWQKRHV